MPRMIHVSDDMDAAEMDRLRPLFDELATGKDDVVIDMAGVGFIDSSGIGGLVFLYKRLFSLGRNLSLVNVDGQPLRLITHLRVTNLVAKAEAGAA